MFDYLTKYLLQYKRVSIPSVGTIHLVQQPAQLNVADKLILPPSYATELKNEDNIPEHQLSFLASTLNEEKDSVVKSLNELGIRLKEKIAGEGFDWKGIGVIRLSNETVAMLSAEGLQPVPAERILRQDAEHRVLVGDQHLTSTQIAELKEDTIEHKPSVLVTVGWVILLLSILYIIFVLWQGKFRVGATGSKSAPTGFIQSAEMKSPNMLYT